MTIRTRTVEYAFPQSIAAVASAAARTFTAKTVTVEENSSRTILSAHIEYYCVDNGGTAASLTAANLSVQVDAVGASAATVTQTLTNSGENQSFQFLKDVTAYFQTNFTGVSHSITVAMTLTGVSTVNAYAKLVLTYSFDDTTATKRTKTVKIPVDGNTGNLTTSFVNLGGVASQIPNLDTFLPETTKVYKSIFFQWETHSGTTAAAAATLDISYDGGTTTISDQSWGHTLISDTKMTRIDDLTSTLSTSATGTIQAKTTSVTGKPCPCLNGYLVVTYTYEHNVTTQVMNSLQIPIMDEAGLNGGNATGDKGRFVRSVSVQEPGTITLAQSGVLVTAQLSGAMTLDLRIGGQASRTFAHAATARCGGIASMRRFDSGAAGGAGMTLAAGSNAFQVDWFSTGTTSGNIGSNSSGLLFLNYISDLHSDGDGVHNHTIEFVSRPYATGQVGTGGSRYIFTPSTTPSVPETEYWLASFGYKLFGMTYGTAMSSFGFAFQGEVQSGEAEGAGWRAFYNCLAESDAEMGPFISFARARDDMRRWPLDSDTSRLDPETSRSYRFDVSVSQSTTNGLVMQATSVVSYHSITTTLAGDITDSGGGTVNIEVYRDSDFLLVGTTSRSGDGAYSMVVYDAYDLYTVVAKEDSTHGGVSTDTSYDISLYTGGPGGGGGGPTYFAF